MLRKAISISALFFVALVLFPMAAKTMHELAHEHEDQCEVQGAHFCQHEHSCSVCDYTLSPAFTPRWNELELRAEIVVGASFPVFYTTAHLRPSGYSFSLRGPPSCC